MESLQAKFGEPTPFAEKAFNVLQASVKLLFAASRQVTLPASPLKQSTFQKSTSRLIQLGRRPGFPVAGEFKAMLKRLGVVTNSETAFHVGVLVLPNFSMLSFASFVDTLRLAADEGDRSRQINCRWTVVGPTMQPVKSSCSAEVLPWETLGDPSRFDYIAVVGGLLDQRSMYEPAVLNWIRSAASAGTQLIGLCTGTFTLFKSGVMSGRRCCISAYSAHEFKAEFPDATPITDQWFIVDGNRITCPGGIAAADVAAFLVKRHCGEAWARKGLQFSLIARPKSQNYPQPVTTVNQPIAHQRLQRAVALIEQQLWEPPTLEQLSARAHLSTRQLQRLFKQHFGCGPSEFSRKVRLRYGRWLLKRTDRTVTDIADSCGFRDAPRFCRQFRALFDMSPLQARVADRSASDVPEPAGESDYLPWRPEPDVHTLSAAA